MTVASKLVERVAFALGTGLGVGYSKFAPGTAGSAVGLLAAYAASRLAVPWQLVALAAATALAIWSAGVVARSLGRKDPGLVVSDEVVGMMLTMVALPFTALSATLGFLLFRVMDIVKPFPARPFERFPGGLGIVADDLMAAVYAHVCLRVLLFGASRLGLA
jgi:phosphatidylglycerophosphatase A